MSKKEATAKEPCRYHRWNWDVCVLCGATRPKEPEMVCVPARPTDEWCAKYRDGLGNVNAFSDISRVLAARPATEYVAVPRVLLEQIAEFPTDEKVDTSRPDRAACLEWVRALLGGDKQGGSK